MRKDEHTILLVEDDHDIREVLRDLLEGEGYSVVEAGNGLEGLAKLDHVKDPCVILLDLMMPVMDGVQFLSELERRGLAELRQKVVVASADRQAKARVDRFSVFALLTKPFALDDLLRVVSRKCALA